jgi:Flp pilus assembly protein TadD
MQKDPKSHNTKGIELLNKGQAKEAIAEFQASLAIDAKQFLTHYNLGLALKKIG